jgi:hypothetical protein
LDDLDPIYRQLLDQPITQTLGLIGFDGRISLTPIQRQALQAAAEYRGWTRWWMSSSMRASAAPQDGTSGQPSTVC